MEKKIWIPLLVGVILLAMMFVPYSVTDYDDGGTKEYTAVAYKVVCWNRVQIDGTYQNTRVYFGADRFKSLDELWAQEKPQSAPLDDDDDSAFFATVLELHDKSVLVEPFEGEWERTNCSDKIYLTLQDSNDIALAPGHKIQVTYTGGIAESYPAQIQDATCSLLSDQRHMNYPWEWLNKDAADTSDSNQSADLIITEIYADCFLATHILPSPDTVKVNTRLSEKWCVGDRVYVTYDTAYHVDGRTECDLLTIDQSTFELDPDVAYKPVIYLYPTQKTDVSVKLTLDGQLTCTYPAYRNGWFVTAAPDGTLTDEQGQTYNYLYWEGNSHVDWDTSRGFCIRGEDTAAFLESALSALRLTRREANEFIVYWLPHMQNNPYNIICFQTALYTEYAKLDISPVPDTVIRVFMTYQPSDTYVELPPQALSAPSRNGFTVVEWGGTRLQ